MEATSRFGRDQNIWSIQSKFMSVRGRGTLPDRHDPSTAIGNARNSPERRAKYEN